MNDKLVPSAVKSRAKKQQDMLTRIAHKKVMFVSGETPMDEVVAEMRDHNISCVIVLDLAFEAVGIITERDIVQKFTLLELKDKLKSKAFALMTRPVFFARLEHLVEDVRRLFLEKRIRHFPISKGGSHHASNIVGVITVTDLAIGWIEGININSTKGFSSPKDAIAVISTPANFELYKTLFEALSMNVISNDGHFKILELSNSLEVPIILDLDELEVEVIKDYLSKLKNHKKPVLILASQEKLVTPLSKALSSRLFQVVLKPLDISSILTLLSRISFVWVFAIFFSSCRHFSLEESETKLTKNMDEYTEWLTAKSRLDESLWIERRQKILQDVAQSQKPSILLLGDSITQGWSKHQDLWNECLPKVQVVNAGIWSDGLQHMLWRIEQGDFDSLYPKLILFLGGTNNGDRTAMEIAMGTKKLIEVMTARFEQVKIILFGVFPMDFSENTSRREKRRQVNRILKSIKWNLNSVEYIDLSPLFLGGTTFLQKEISPDFLHLSRRGYELWMAGICPLLRASFEAV